MSDSKDAFNKRYGHLGEARLGIQHLWDVWAAKGEEITRLLAERDCLREGLDKILLNNLGSCSGGEHINGQDGFIASTALAQANKIRGEG